MHKYKIWILALSIFFFSFLKAMAISDADYLSIVEQNLFNMQYKNETITKRLNRVESSIFGKNNTGTTQIRIQKIKTALGYEEPTPPPSKVQPKSPAQKPVKSASNQKIQLVKPTSTIQKIPTIQYPAVDQIEKKVLNQTFPGEDIYKRLDRLEIVVYKQTSQASLNERVDRLKYTVFGSSENNMSSDNSLNYSNTLLNSDAVNSVITQLENQTFKTAYPNEPIEVRLDRLENQIFNQTSPEDSVNDRVERLAAVISAQPSNEEFRDMSTIRQYQNVATGMTAATIILLILKGLIF